MKHNMWKTATIILYLLAALLSAFWLTPQIVQRSPDISEMISPGILIGLIIGIVIGSAIAWWYLLKHFKPKNVDWLMGIVIAASVMRVCTLFIPFMDEVSWTAFIVRAAVTMFFLFGFIYVLRKMQQSWSETLRWYFVVNFLMVFAIATTSIYVGLMMRPWVAAVILLVLAIYDAIAVWKLGSMVQLAQFFMERRIVPAIAIPYKEEEGRFALLGGGDVFAMIFVSVSFWKVDQLAMYCVGIGSFSALVLLLFFSQKKKFYPALPFMFVGYLVGLGVWWLL